MLLVPVGGSNNRKPESNVYTRGKEGPGTLALQFVLSQGPHQCKMISLHVFSFQDITWQSAELNPTTRRKNGLPTKLVVPSVTIHAQPEDVIPSKSFATSMTFLVRIAALLTTMMRTPVLWKPWKCYKSKKRQVCILQWIQNPAKTAFWSQTNAECVEKLNIKYLSCRSELRWAKLFFGWAPWWQTRGEWKLFPSWVWRHVPQIRWHHFDLAIFRQERKQNVKALTFQAKIPKEKYIRTNAKRNTVVTVVSKKAESFPFEMCDQVQQCFRLIHIRCAHLNYSCFKNRIMFIFLENCFFIFPQRQRNTQQVCLYAQNDFWSSYFHTKSYDAEKRTRTLIRNL